MKQKIILHVLVIVITSVFSTVVYSADLYGWLKRGNKANVEIQLKSASNTLKKVTNQNGLYEFKNIPPGNYEILVNNVKSGQVSVKPGQNRFDLK